MAHEFKLTRCVEFAETDMAGIMHFANYFRFMEAAEHAFFRSLGLSVHESSAEGMKGFARVHASCDYIAPLRYQDEVEVHLTVAEKSEKAITYEAVFRKLNQSDASPPVPEIARGRWTVVCVRKDREETQIRSVPIPSEFDSKIQVAPTQALGDKDE